MTRYLTTSEMDRLITSIKALKSKECIERFPYTIKVDGESFRFKTIPSVRKFLQGCTFPQMIKVFRNFLKGVTVDLDDCHGHEFPVLNV